MTITAKHGNIINVVMGRHPGHACGCGGMADAQDSKSCGGDLVWVQVPPSALNGANLNPLYFFKKVFAVVVKFARKE